MGFSRGQVGKEEQEAKLWVVMLTVYSVCVCVHVCVSV